MCSKFATHPPRKISGFLTDAFVTSSSIDSLLLDCFSMIDPFGNLNYLIEWDTEAPDMVVKNSAGKSVKNWPWSVKAFIRPRGPSGLLLSS
jgi:hypothetical protein